MRNASFSFTARLLTVISAVDGDISLALCLALVRLGVLLIKKSRCMRQQILKLGAYCDPSINEAASAPDAEAHLLEVDGVDVLLAGAVLDVELKDTVGLLLVACAGKVSAQETEVAVSKAASCDSGERGRV